MDTEHCLYSTNKTTVFIVPVSSIILYYVKCALDAYAYYINY